MCSRTPRFSYGCPKTGVGTALLAACSTACTVWVGSGWVPGWGIRVGTGRAIPGYYPATCSREEGPSPSGAGPGSPCKGLEWVGTGSWTRARRRFPGPPLRGPVSPPCGLPCPGTLIAASWPIWRDLTSFPRMLVKTAECHQNMTKRPALVPISKTGPKSHLLKF